MTKVDRVKAALQECYAWYAKMDINIRTKTERIDALWHEVDHYVACIEQAERDNNEEAATVCLAKVIHFVTRIESEAYAARF